MATFNRLIKDVGNWSLTFDVPGDGSVAAFNSLADWSVAVFLEAFAGMGEVERAFGDVEVLDEAAQCQRDYIEDVPLVQVDGDRFRPALDSGVPQPSDTVLLYSVKLECGLTIIDAETSREVRLHDCFQFTHLSNEHFTPQGELLRDEPFAYVSTSTDVWLDVTPDPRTRDPRDNRRTATLNRPRLEAFLRRWEQLAGKPIDEWESEQTRRIRRYGFAPVPPGEEW